MITCELAGRLGNNLFQIANVISLANKLSTDFILPNFSMAGHRGRIPVDLNMFGYKFERGEYVTPIEYVEERYEYTKVTPVNNLKLKGFYQSWRYFEDVRTQVLSKYFIPSEEVLKNLNKYNLSNSSLGISVRRGDYLMLQNNHCILGVDYYQKAFDDHFKNKVDQIFVFSDDLPWCRQIFGPTATYVEDTVGTQLFLMSKMKNLILSNSTFAWWGGYLNQNEGTIIAPDPWYGPDYKDKGTDGIYYSNWIKLNHTIQQHPFQLTQNMFD